MKLNYKSILTSAALMIISANANANLVYDLYAGGTAGFGGTYVYSKEDGNGMHSQAYGAVIGIDLPVVRFEAEYNYTDSDHFDMNLAMGNAYVKLPAFIGVNPYIGVGVGIMLDAHTDYATINIKPGVAYQGMLGATLEIPVLPFKVDFEGRALVAPEIYTIAKEEFHALQYDARVKLRYVF